MTKKKSEEVENVSASNIDVKKYVDEGKDMELTYKKKRYQIIRRDRKWIINDTQKYFSLWGAKIDDKTFKEIVENDLYDDIKIKGI